MPLGGEAKALIHKINEQHSITISTMLIQYRSLCQLPIASVRSGGRIGKVSGVILNPDTLKVAAYHCSITGIGKRLMLPQDIFETTRMGFIIRDHDSLISEEDAIRLQPLIKLNYPLIGLKAYVGNVEWVLSKIMLSRRHHKIYENLR